MSDKRSAFQKAMWDKIGPPLYYSDVCKLEVKVNSAEDIQRPCGDCNCAIIAPRRAIATGDGSLNMGDSVKMAAARFAAALTGRCV